MPVNYEITVGLGIHKKMEQLQLEAVRIVTGLPIFIKTEILYIETGWELLSACETEEKEASTF